MYARALVFQLHTVRTLTVTIQFERSGVDRCEEWLLQSTHGAKHPMTTFDMTSPSKTGFDRRQPAGNYRTFFLPVLVHNSCFQAGTMIRLHVQ